METTSSGQTQPDYSGTWSVGSSAFSDTKSFLNPPMRREEAIFEGDFPMP